MNLIPASRRDAKRRRLHTRWCAAGCAVYAAAALAGAVACQLSWGGARPALAAQIHAADEQVSRAKARAAVTHAHLAAAHTAMDADRQIAEQPDWSHLLGVLARQSGDQIVFNSCAVGPNLQADASPAAVPPAAKTPGSGASRTALALTVSGFGRSQLAISQFVLRLEKTGLFARVAVQTHRETYLGGEAVSFQLICSLDEPAGKGTP
ncbi:MAG TPA: PilN domain-containing protein [Tepidisphaeraceae bacterium]|nr:PilN domain-containing protein [Tepidisphaeraceae bacterium]